MARRVLFFSGLAGLTNAHIPSELEGSSSLEDVYEKLTSSSELQAELPVELAGANLTIDNLKKWFTIVKSEMKVGSNGLTSSVADTCIDGLFADRSEPDLSVESSGDIDPAALINAGESAWQFIHDNSYSVDVTQSGTGTPQGVDLGVLTGWKHLQCGTRSGKHITYKWINAAGQETSMDWGFHWYWNGHLKGGDQQYTKEIMVDTFNVDSKWGWKINCNAAVYDPVDIGEPVGHVIAANTFKIQCTASDPIGSDWQKFYGIRVMGNGQHTRDDGMFMI